MGSHGPNNSGTLADDSTLGAVAITNPGNAQASDNSYATAVLLLSQISHYLKGTNFGFTIPTDSVITGVLVEIERSTTLLNTVVDDSVRLVKGGVISGDEKATANAWPTTDAYASYGSASDMWGLTLTPADINASTFGVVVAAQASLGAATAQIDHIRVTVSFTGSNRPGNAIRRVSVGGGMSKCEGAS